MWRLHTWHRNTRPWLGSSIKITISRSFRVKLGIYCKFIARADVWVCAVYYSAPLITSTGGSIDISTTRSLRVEGIYNGFRSTVVMRLKNNLADCKVVTLPNIFSCIKHQYLGKKNQRNLPNLSVWGASEVRFLSIFTYL